MKSRAHFKSHPIHPILVNFPIAFFVGTLLFDLLGVILGRPDFYYISYYLNMAGIAFGLLAAVPGLIDFITVVPPKSSGKKRAAQHGVTNVLMLIAFAIAFYLKRATGISIYIIIGIEVIGNILLGIAGWMGGTLVFRNQIGVDIRYANAGKWKELTIDKANGPVRVATTDELKLNQMKLVHINGKRIVICKTQNGFAAFDDHCPHRGGSLAGGSMICDTVQCPWHGSQFDVNDGKLKAGPAKEGIKTYPLNISGNEVFLQIPEVIAK